jgi:chromosome segregation ATPase
MTLRDRLEELFDEEDRLNAEIERLKEALHEAGVRNGKLVLQLREKDHLLTECADALEHADWTSDYEQRWKNNDLIQRAREATR